MKYCFLYSLLTLESKPYYIILTLPTARFLIVLPASPLAALRSKMYADLTPLSKIQQWAPVSIQRGAKALAMLF